MSTEEQFMREELETSLEEIFTEPSFGMNQLFLCVGRNLLQICLVSERCLMLWRSFLYYKIININIDFNDINSGKWSETVGHW